MAFALQGLVALLAASCAAANSVYLAKLCRGHTCSEPQFPILDYSPTDGACVCTANPCWNDASGVSHSCPTPDYPYSRFVYNSRRRLICECSAFPYYGSSYLASYLCPGQLCEDPAFPVLDYEGGKCICRAHPCDDMHGETHRCLDARYPILRYREDKTGPVCECMARLEDPSKTEL
mmetsp:Transcript_45390/g.131019  ORF Transcript_45390/g.131019 Transcript_45390/m.131019 type:complete len:177 (-) Transcript_45390:108-638(-)